VSHPLYIAGQPSWTQPTLTGVGRLPSRAPLIPFPNEDLARAGVRGASPWMQNLSGVWSFRLVANPQSVTWSDVADEGTEWGPIMVPGAWNDVRNFSGEGGDALHPERGTPHYTNVLMPFDDEPPMVPQDNNPTGVYRTFVDLDSTWTSRRTILQLGGTDSMHHVFVNGQPVGVGTDTRVTSEYDITDVVHEGRNTVIIVVIRWSASTWLEDQDQWWMAGITREVLLLSVGQVHMQHVRATTGARNVLSPDPTGTLDAEVHIRFAAGPPQRGWSIRCQVETRDGKVVSGHTRADESYPLPFLPGKLGGAQPGQIEKTETEADLELGAIVTTQPVPVLDRRSPGQTAHDGNVFAGHRVRFHAELPSAVLWSSEDPHMYRLVCALINPDGVVTEVVSQLIGFRTVEVKNRELLLNGKPVLIRGVNRHDHDEYSGAAPSRSTMRLDLETMKRFNVNAVRMSHYPPDPYVLEVCDELGLWVIDETNLETHARYRSLVHDPGYQSQCLERILRMVARDENHPSIIAWSLGNESGYGPIHDAMAAWTRHYDPSRIVHYEGPHRYDLGTHGRIATDIIAPMYPSLERIEAWAKHQAATPDDDRPLILCEYSHAMGNSNGSLADHDDLFRAHHGLQGGFIWEWIDHGLRVGSDFDGRPVWAYGGHFGEQPHDGPFVADGLVWPDRTPHPGLFEAAHVWRPVRVRLADSGDLLIINDRDFLSLDDLQCTYEVLVNGSAVELGSIDVPHVAAGHTVAVSLPGSHLKLAHGEEGHVTVRWSTREAKSWCAANHVLAWDQVALPVSTGISMPAPPGRSAAEISVVDDRVIASGAISRMEHTAQGALVHLHINGESVLQSPPEFRIWRARIDNDGVPEGQLGLPGIGRTWATWGIRDAAYRTISDVSRPLSGSETPGLVMSTSTVIRPSGTPAAAVTVSERRTISDDGTIVFRYQVDVPTELGDLPRLGTVFSLTDLEQLEWFGLGPLETYADRRSAATVARWKSTVSEQYVPYIHPQDHGRHEATRWVHIHNGRVGLVFTAHPGMRLFSFSARHFDDAELNDTETANHLIPRAKTIVSIDHRVRGIGTGSCGPDTLPVYRIGAGQYEWSFALSVWAAGQDPSAISAAVNWSA
jgi:beta-galactosidase